MRTNHVLRTVTRGGAACAVLVIAAAAGAQVANDECENAEPLALGVPVAGMTALTTGLGASCTGNDHDVWYVFLPEPNTTYRASTTSDFGGIAMAAYQQQCPPAGTELDCGEWVTFTSDAAGSPVFISVATGGFSTAIFDVVVEPAIVPGNDLCASALAVNPGDVVTGSTIGASTDGNSSCGGGGNTDVWFSLTAPVTGPYTIDTCGSNFHTLLTMFEECGGIELACTHTGSADGCEARARLDEVNLRRGETYLIRLAAFGETPAEGSYTLTLSPAPIAMGACCSGGSCSRRSEADCIAGGGAYAGDDTACETTPNAVSSHHRDIPDNEPAGIADSVTIAEPQTVTTVEVQVDLQHPWMGDLIVTLQGPNGATVDLVNRAGVTVENPGGFPPQLLAAYVFSDSGTQTLPDAAAGLPSGALTPAGTYLPSTAENGEQSLNAAFAGIDAAGTWTLTVSDNLRDFVGGLRGWGLSINGGIRGACEAPPPCPCEADGDDEQVNVFDLLSYLDLWFPGDPGADLDGAAGVDVFDLLAFLDCWFPASAGTPC